MSSLQGKKVLFFAPKFFNYEVAIKEEIECQGATVHLYDERCNPSSLEKIIIRKCPFFMKNKIFKNYSLIIKKEEDFSPDYIFFLSPETATKECIDLMKKTWPNSLFILCMYDSIKNKNAKNIYMLFDRCLSFDPNDCKKYNFIFRPLFFMKAFEAKNEDISYRYDFSFIGSVHSDRAKILYKLKEEFDKEDLSYYYYLYFPGKLMYLARFILDPYIRKFPKKYLYTKAIDKNTVADISKHTRCIIDINHPKQTGLTMRTIEMLGLNQKILSTNRNIKNYDFYEPLNQLIVDRNKIEIDSTFVKSKYTPVEDSIYSKYKLESWVSDVFNLGDK